MKLRGRDRQRQERQETDGAEKMKRARAEPGRQGEEVNGRTDGGCHSFTLSQTRLPEDPSSLLTSHGQEVTEKGEVSRPLWPCLLWSYEASSMTLELSASSLKKRVVMVVGVELLSHVWLLLG